MGKHASLLPLDRWTPRSEEMDAAARMHAASRNSRCARSSGGLFLSSPTRGAIVRTAWRAPVKSSPAVFSRSCVHYCFTSAR